MKKNFLEAVQLGKNDRWRYLLSIVAILYYYLHVAGLIALSLTATLTQVFGQTRLGSFVALMCIFPPVIGILFWAVTKLHNRPFQTLVNADASVNMRRLLWGFAAWLLQLTVIFGADIWLAPQHYSFSFHPAQWFTLLPLAMIFIPMQTSAEELLFRGYLMQGLGLIIKHRLALILTISLVFAVPHFANPEMQRGFTWGALTYLLWGIFFATITLKDNGLELALGCHAANNLFSTLVLNTPDSTIPTTAIWTYIEPIDSRVGFISLLIQTAVFYCLFFGGIPRRCQKG
ncbi:MAG: type II CAAX endopeptidase family protein [Cyanobacteria bacterium P01_A01_bin.114]